MVYAQIVLMHLTNAMATRMEGARRSKGQGLVEYALVIAVVAVIAVVGLTFLGTKLSATFSNLVTNLNLPNPGE